MKLRICLAILLFPAIALADSSAVIIQGVGGSEEIEARFSKWAAETEKILVEDMGYAKDHVVLLAGESARKVNIEKTFGQVKAQVKPQDTVILFLIGSGSFDVDYKLNILGQDLTGKEYAKLIDDLNPARSVIIAASTSSGGLIETAAAKNRIILAGSRSGEKEEGTSFYQNFLAALKGNAADEDKDKKVTIWEAYKYAAAAFERFYKEQTRLQTEHPALAANGAAQVDLKVSDQDAPVLARLTAFNAERAIVVADPRLQALLNEKKAIEQKIEALRLQKSLLSEDEYDKRLEEFVLELTRKNRQIQEQDKK